MLFAEKNRYFCREKREDKNKSLFMENCLIFLGKQHVVSDVKIHEILKPILGKLLKPAAEMDFSEPNSLCDVTATTRFPHPPRPPKSLLEIPTTFSISESRSVDLRKSTTIDIFVDFWSPRRCDPINLVHN